jgi:hypothetical protein
MLMVSRLCFGLEKKIDAECYSQGEKVVALFNFREISEI